MRPSQLPRCVVLTEPACACMHVALHTRTWVHVVRAGAGHDKVGAGRLAPEQHVHARAGHQDERAHVSVAWAGREQHAWHLLERHAVLGQQQPPAVQTMACACCGMCLLMQTTSRGGMSLCPPLGRRCVALDRLCMHTRLACGMKNRQYSSYIALAVRKR